MIAQNIKSRIPTKDELLEDYKNNPERFSPEGWHICKLDTSSASWIRLRPSDGYWSYVSNSNYVRGVR